MQFFLYACLVLALSLVTLADAKGIHTQLAASWDETSFFQEGCEGIARLYGAPHFYSCLEALWQSVPGGSARELTQQEQYTKMLDVIHSMKGLTTPMQALARAELVARSHSPAVETHYTLAQAELEKELAHRNAECAGNAFALVYHAGGRVFLTDVREAEEALGRWVQEATSSGMRDGGAPWRQKVALYHTFDHVHPQSSFLEDARVVVVLYGLAADVLTKQWLDAFTSKMAALPMYLLFRHLPASPYRACGISKASVGSAGKHLAAKVNPLWEEPLYVPGYASTVDFKSMEYKVIDEKKKKEGEAEAERPPDKEASAATPKRGGVRVAEGFVGGFYTGTLKRRYPQHAVAVDTFAALLEAETSTMDVKVDLKEWELQHLGKAAVQIISNAAKEQRLGLLKDIVTRFPTYARALSEMSLDADNYKNVSSILEEQSNVLTQGVSAFFLDGIGFDPASASLHSMLAEVARSEKMIDAVRAALVHNPRTAAGSTAEEARLDSRNVFESDDALSKWMRSVELDFSNLPDSGAARVYVPEGHVLWLADVESNQALARLPATLRKALDPVFVQRNLLPRRNLVTSVYVVDPTDKESLSEPVRAYQATESGLFLRIGVIFYDAAWSETAEAVNTHVHPAGKKLASTAKYLSAALYAMNDGRATLDALYVMQTLYLDIKQNAKAKEPESVHLFAADAVEKYTQTTLDKVLSSPDFGAWYHAQQLALRTSRMSQQIPAVYLNGIQLKDVAVKSVYHDYLEEMVNVRKLIETSVLRDADTHLYDTILKHFNAREKVRTRFTSAQNYLPLDTADLFDFVASRPYVYAETYDGMVSPATLILAIPCEAPVAGALSALELALNFVKAPTAALRVRLTVVTCPAGPSSFASQIEHVWRAAETLPEERRAGFLLEFVDHVRREVETQAAAVALTNVTHAPYLHLDYTTLSDTLLKYERRVTKTESRRLDHAQRKFFENVRLRGPWHDPHLPWLFANGITQALAADFTEDDLRDIVGDCATLTQTVAAQIDAVPFTRSSVHFAAEDLDSAFYATKIALVSSIATPLAKRLSGRRVIASIHDFIKSSGGKTAFKVKPAGAIRHHLCVVVDPVLRESQLIIALSEHFLNSPLGVHLTVLMNPSPNVRIPIRNLYAFAADWEARFDAEGRVVAPSSVFRGLPPQALLTLGVDAPYAWTVFPSETDYDLDNILLSRLPADVALLTATYRIHSLVFAGSAYLNGAPAQGLPLQVTPLVAEEKAVDTLVMINMGYYQLLARPGVWHLSISAGPIASAFYIDAINAQKLSAVRNGELMPSQAKEEEGQQQHQQQQRQRIPILLDSFEGKDLNLDVVPMDADATVTLKELIQRSYTAKRDAWPPAGGKGKTQKPPKPTLNIFSVASGHLYERFLRMMMRSVFLASSDVHCRNTTRIKFWIIENFLSPQFKLYIPAIADKYGFEVQFVTYQWPFWLNPQTEKQRRIWAYKILFLDVLFPLDVDRVIFVDADQTAHADLHDLYNMDIEGNGIAMTPFCEKHKNSATVQFRFWESEYWKRQLDGRPYHISAIFLVDLQQFRSSMSGDIYRLLYQQYSTDPSSLANLDQDLPNVLQNLVPIYSLPEEWLWCETWCDQESKKNAKTIDLCNNPLTKVPKLQNAKTIVPQWEEWDRELESLSAEILTKEEIKR